MVKVISFLVIAICMAVSSQQVYVSEPKLALTGQFPHHVSFRGVRQTGDAVVFEHVCSGAILNERWTISSADCLIGYTNCVIETTLKVVVGSVDKYENSNTYDVNDLLFHDNFDFNHPDKAINFNVALAKTTKPIQFGENIRPIAVSHKYFAGGEVATISGWKERTSDGHTEYLRYAMLNILSTEKCAEHYRQNDSLVNSETLCGKYISTLSINDYGCPLVSSGRLIGISLPDDSLGRPKRFTRMSLVADWIDSATELS